MNSAYYKTTFGQMLFGDSTQMIKNELLIITSPPFPLNAKKKYGNLQGEAYKEWFASLAPLYSELLTDDGSIVIEIGNSWEANRPVQSILHLESLLAFMKAANLNLIQEFICYNPSRLPSPAQWVTVNRIRTVDSYTHVWWLSKSDYPKADNRKVLRPYSKGMEDLIKRQTYNTGKRPSGHSIGKTSFLNDNGGGIAHNLLEFEPIEKSRLNRLPKNITEYINLLDNPELPTNILSISNTNSADYYSKKCRELNITRHPATMQPGLIAFFVNFLTDEHDIVLDPFGGSNTTGYIAEKLKRKWFSIEILQEYIEQSIYRFEEPSFESNLEILHKK